MISLLLVFWLAGIWKEVVTMVGVLMAFMMNVTALLMLADISSFLSGAVAVR